MRATAHAGVVSEGHCIWRAHLHSPSSLLQGCALGLRMSSSQSQGQDINVAGAQYLQCIIDPLPAAIPSLVFQWLDREASLK